MRSANTVSAIGLRRAVALAIVTALLILAGCTFGEPVMPNPPTGVPADRSVGQVASIPNPIPHTLEGRQECFACHASGAVDAPAVPPGHEQDMALCTTCHAVWRAPAIAAAAPPAIPHELEGREDCLTCHKVGTAGAPQVPDNHAGLPSSICPTCHISVEEIVGASEGEGTTTAQAPPIPHGLEGFSACTSCHELGGPGIPRFPEDHQGRTDDICSACHRPAAEAPQATPTAEPAVTPTVASQAAPTAESTASPTQAPTVAAGDAANGQSLFAANCAPCHGPNGEGTAFVPDALNNAQFLAGRTNEDLTTTIQTGVGGRMPAFATLSDQEVLDLLAFIRTWQ
jgi:mono/diheme cytochrome c family protein